MTAEALDAALRFGADLAEYRSACAACEAAWSARPRDPREVTDAHRAAVIAADAVRDAAERVMERSACAMLSTIGGADAGAWLRGRLDYDGTGP